MANKTANDVVSRALRILNITAIGEAPDAGVYAIAEDEYKVFNEWGREEFERRWSWSYDMVDERYWTHVAAMLAGRLAYVLPCGEAAASRANSGAARSERYLREQLARKRLEPVEIAYF